MNGDTINGRSLSEILAEMREEFQEFAQTRIELLRRELEEKIRAFKAALPLAVAGAMFLGVSFVLFSFALVGLVAVAFQGTAYRWFLAFLIVGFLWSICGGIAALLAKRELTRKGVMPRKILQILNGDKAWLQREAKNLL